MLKKMATLSVILAATTNIAVADPMHHKHHHKHHYKQAVESTPSYKGEVAAPAPVAINYFEPSWYVGASLGSRINDNSAGAVYKGLEGTISGGYGGAWYDSYYLAGELALADSIQMVNHSRRSGSVRSGWNVSLSALPGYLLTQDALGFLRLGIASVNYTSPNTNAFTGILGLGLQVALCRNWDVRGEWDYGFARSIKGGVPRSQLFNLGAIYKFL